MPDALHSSVAEPPFRAVICPLVGTALILGGTDVYERRRTKGTNALVKGASLALGSNGLRYNNSSLSCWPDNMASSIIIIIKQKSGRGLPRISTVCI